MKIKKIQVYLLILSLGLSIFSVSCVSKDEHESAISDYKKAAEESEKQITEMQEKLTEAESKLNSLSTPSTASGTWFKVQIGAYNNIDLSQYKNINKNLGIETEHDGTLKYTLGAFQSYEDATSFKLMMKDMGVRGAWIVSYKDGQRVDVNDAL